MSGEQPLLVVENLVAGYEPGLPIVNGASIRLEAGEIVAILGPNGAGKSTLIKAIAGLAPISGGAVTFDGRDVTRLPAHCMIRLGLAFTPQTENVFASLSVDDNLQLAAGVLAKALRADRIAVIYTMLPDLARQRRLLAGRLSGGQRQMLAIARALLVAPKALMLDEPSAGLSPKLAEMVFARLADIRRSGVGILLVEQNTRAALNLADRAYVLVQGRARHQGPAWALANDPMIAALYLGGVETEGTP
jgi:branched-chain amino acid transport system ATP-binding protein